MQGSSHPWIPPRKPWTKNTSRCTDPFVAECVRILNVCMHTNADAGTQVQMDIARQMQNELHSVCEWTQPQTHPDVTCLFKDLYKDSGFTICICMQEKSCLPPFSLLWFCPPSPPDQFSKWNTVINTIHWASQSFCCDLKSFCCHTLLVLLTVNYVI